MPTDAMASNSSSAELPIVLQPDVDQVVEAGGGHALPRPRRLLAADGDAHDSCLVSLGGMHREGAPAAPDVEEPTPRRLVETQLAADQLVLVGLGLGQAHGRRREPGTRVRHGRAEHDVVELVADVVVVAHHLAVAAQGVTPAARSHLLGRRRERGADDAGEPSRLPRSWQRACHEAHTSALDMIEGTEHGEEIAVHVEVAGHVGAPDAERVGRPEDPPHRLRSDLQRAHGVDGTQRAAVPRLEANRWGIPRDGHGERAEGVGDGPRVRFGQDLDAVGATTGATGRVLVGEVAVRRSQPAAASGEAHAADLPARS